ncbi:MULTISPECIES: hypothetical protein [unclassified Methylobacterium]|jgi:hypothetical protein|uniref:hypothetical protein n=1 Tax=unclassified Methylobacterium TaxID=2615210 RepID=UPI0013526A85|nr:hypothetical protein [Methylobacterium sp. 2A]MWV20571.1 hypothetical protein [Methylobacterium sp. 2A]
MASIDPELRRRQLAKLRAAYDASPRLADADIVGTSIARHSRALLGRILLALSGPHGGAGAPMSRPDGKTCADV